jgi:branched-chain amino acid aminotransferase
MNHYYKNTTVNINGTIVSEKDAQISIFDRGFLFGDSVYEVSYSKDKSILFWDEHLKRLKNSANLLNMNFSYSDEYITNQVIKTLRESKLKDAYFRIIVTRGCSEISLNPNIATHNNLIIIVMPKPVYANSMYEKGIELLLSNIHRNSLKSTNPNAKSGNYLNNVMAINEAKSLGVYDSIMVNAQGELTEGTSFNLWLVKNNRIVTPKHNSGLLLGITREKILNIKEIDNIKIEEELLYPKDLENSQEMFITSATRGVMPVKSIIVDNKKIEFSSSNIIKKLQTTYDEYVLTHIKETSYKY